MPIPSPSLRLGLVALVAVTAMGCGRSGPGADVVPVDASRTATTALDSVDTTTAQTTDAPSTTLTTASTIPATTIPATSIPATTIPATPVDPGAPATVPPPQPDCAAQLGDTSRLDLGASRLTIGCSVQGRPITAERFGEPGTRRLLVVGVIHGNESAGTQITQALRSMTVPAGNELWIVESMNPDGQAIDDRQNANEVDLNRNFPYEWEPLGQPGDGQYAGTAPASEPETQAMTNFISQLRPDIAVWYHQDLNVIAPAKGRAGDIRARYAELSGLPLAPFSTGGARYTGIAATWARHELEAQAAVPFIVELGPSIDNEEARRHADALMTIASEF